MQQASKVETLQDCEPKDFFKSYISARRPVVLSISSDLASVREKWSDVQYLAETAGEAEVLVEPINAESKQFGTGVKRTKMSFAKFLQGLDSDAAQDYYLTTQYDDEEPLRVPPPLSHLRRDLPLQPKLMGNLILQQMNLWMGKSQQGSSSGLHHDHQDNLYLLIRGTKRFVLYPPSAASCLYPYGKVEKIHSNGVISYTTNQTRADGLHPRHYAEEEVEALEAALIEPDVERRQELEERLDKANDRLMDFMLQAGEEEPDAYDEMQMGLDEGEDGDFGALADPEEESDEDEDEGGVFPPLSNDINAASEDGEDNPQPASFSKIPSSLLHEHLKLTSTLTGKKAIDEFPLLADVEPLIVTLQAGQMLYLPASWWHEVTSTSSDPTEPHIALNYWFHPPDNKDFDQPYEAALVWDHIRREQEKADDARHGKGKKRAISPSSRSNNKRSKV